MVERSTGKSKLTPEVRERLAEMAAEARRLMYGEDGFPEWGTSFAEIENDGKEVGHEFIRLVIQQVAEEQVESLPSEALRTDTGEVARSIGTDKRVIETESGPVTWNEPKGYLPKSRKAFFPSVEGDGSGGG